MSTYFTSKEEAESYLKTASYATDEYATRVRAQRCIERPVPMLTLADFYNRFRRPPGGPMYHQLVRPEKKAELQAGPAPARSRFL